MLVRVCLLLVRDNSVNGRSREMTCSMPALVCLCACVCSEPVSGAELIESGWYRWMASGAVCKYLARFPLASISFNKHLSRLLQFLKSLQTVTVVAILRACG